MIIGRPGQLNKITCVGCLLIKDCQLDESNKSKWWSGSDCIWLQQYKDRSPDTRCRAEPIKPLLPNTWIVVMTSAQSCRSSGITVTSSYPSSCPLSSSIRFHGNTRTESGFWAANCSGVITGIWLPGNIMPCLLTARSATAGNKSALIPA